MPKPPPAITIGVDEAPPPFQLLLLALQYAFLLCVYLVIVVIVVHAAGADAATARSVVSMAMLASAVGTVLQALHRGPVGSGFLALTVRPGENPGMELKDRVANRSKHSA